MKDSLSLKQMYDGSELSSERQPRCRSRTADVPLLQYSDTTVDVPVAKDAEKTPQKQHEDCMKKYNEIQMDKELRSA